MLRFTDQDVKSRLKGKAVISQWIYKVLKDRGYAAGEINIVFCSDDYLLNINKTSLGHDYYTDIITFDYCEGNLVSGDLFISLDTVLANSTTYRQMFTPELKCELLRVIIHGILHLSGEDDITAYQQKKMRRAENICLKTLLSDFDQEKISVNYKA